MLSSILTQAELGHRVQIIRKNKKLSQKETAEMLGISRSSLTQIELGNRNINVIELSRLANTLHFSIDNFLSKNFDISGTIISAMPFDDVSIQERISEPNFNYTKTVNVILYVLNNCTARVYFDEKKLYDLLYLADFNHYEVFEEQMTGAAYYKILDKPFSKDLKGALQQMEKEKRIKKVKVKIGKYTKITYLPLQNTNFKKLKATELHILQKMLQNYKEYSFSTLSEYIKGDSPLTFTDNNNLIDYELVFYRDEKYSVRTYEEENDDD